MGNSSGTSAPVPPTTTSVKCDRFREAASARLDGEPIGMSATVLDHHLTTCVDCARWLEAATRVTWQARLGATEVPDLAERILAGAALLRRRRLLRLALAAVGAVQVGIGAPSLFGGSIDLAMSVHAAHENAAWNVALGAAFLATAMRPLRAAGLLPGLAVFVGVLTALSIRDMASGTVAAGRLATHLGIVAGFLLVYALARAERALPPERRSAPASDDEETGRGLRGVA
jgi:predicted anti-sigma-YlaC factor YlaD